MAFQSSAMMPMATHDSDEDEWFHRNDYGSKTSVNYFQLSPNSSNLRRNTIHQPAPSRSKIRLQLKHDPSIAHAITKSVLAKPLVQKSKSPLKGSPYLHKLQAKQTARSPEINVLGKADERHKGFVARMIASGLASTASPTRTFVFKKKRISNDSQEEKTTEFLSPTSTFKKAVRP